MKLDGCARCGGDLRKLSGFMVCKKCGHRAGDVGLGRQSMRRNSADGELYNVADDKGRLPDADSQNRGPRGTPKRRTPLKF